jgi:hypothetical protein
MRTTRSAAARMIPPVLALVGVLGGCTATAPATGGASSPSIGSAVSAPATTAATRGAAPTTAAGDGAVGPAEQAVADVLQSYQDAVAAGDFALACTQMTVESATALVGAVQGAGALAPTCPEALAAVVGQPGATQAAIEAANSIVIDDVSVAGLSATIRWTSTRQGVPRSDALSMQSVDGQWRLAGPA